MSFLPALPAAESHDPADELASFRIASGYAVNLFASESDGIVNPISMRFDARGRLFVACSWAYPQIEPGQKVDDKILVLEDTDGDGRADKSNVFADGLFMPMGIELGDGGVYVGNGTELLHLKDTDGDGRADQRRVVLRGFGTGDTHQNINSFRWGPGGELMFCQGLHAYSRVETPWGNEKLEGAGVWRFRPRSLRLDPFLDGSMGAHNPWGVDFDDWGQPFSVAGNGHGIYYLLPAMVRTDHFLDFKQIANKSLKYCGMDIIGSSHLPDDVQGLIVTGGFLNNALYWYRLTEDGAGYKATEVPPLIQSTHQSFRAVDVKVGPEGAIYVADFYNPIIGHYQSSFRHPDRDKTHGRIWRVTAKDRPLTPRPQLTALPLPALLDQLKSPERWNRYHAKRLLGDRAAKPVTAALAKWVAKLDARDPRLDHHLFEALGVCESHNFVEPTLLKRLLAAQDYRARAYATRVLGQWHDRLPDALALLALSAADPHPRVRLEAIVACGYVPSPRAVEIALSAVDQPLDKFLDYALTQTIHALKPHWKPAFLAGQLACDSRAPRIEYLLKTDASSDSLRAVASRLESAWLSDDSRETFLRILAHVGGPAELATVLDPQSYEGLAGYNAPLHARLLPSLGDAYRNRKTLPSGDLAARLTKLLKEPEQALRAEVIRLAGVWKLAALQPQMANYATSQTAPDSLRRAGIEALGSLGGVESRQLLSLLSVASPPERVRVPAIASLTLIHLQLAALRAAQWLATNAVEADTKELLGAFLQRQGGAEALAVALKTNPPCADAAKLGLRMMSSIGRQEEKLVAVLGSAAGLSADLKPLTAPELAALAAEVRTHGDAARGAEIYRRPEQNCAACHALDGVGGVIGPDLGALGTAQPADFIIGAVLFPNKEVKEDYLALEVTTKDGEIYQGYKVREDKQELVLRDVAQNREIHLGTDRIKEKIQRGSLMPSGLVNNLTRAELRDLIRYLSELRKRP